MEQVQNGESAFMDAAELARALGIKPHTVWALGRQDKLPIRTIRVGRLMRFSRAEVQRLIEGTPESPAQTPDGR